MARTSRGVSRRGTRATVRGTKARLAGRTTTRQSTAGGGKNSITLARVKKAAQSAGRRAGAAAKNVVERVKGSRRAQLATVAAAGMVAAAVGLVRKRGKKK